MDIIKFFYKENKIMYIASASSNDELIKAAKALKIIDFFNGILGSPRNKIQSIKEIKNLNKKFLNLDFLLIGDALNDLEAARKNNIKFLGYTNDFLSKEKLIIGDKESQLLLTLSYISNFINSFTKENGIN